MIDFKICYPDANTFNKVLKFKTLDEWNCEYVQLAHGIGYWIGEHPLKDNEGFEIFKNLIAAFPIQKDNNHPDNFDPNPFDTIHVPDWVSRDFCWLVKDFYLKNVRDDTYDPQIHEWGNVFFKEKTRPITCWRIPHIDYVHGMVANLWFTSHDTKDSGTKLYHYHGNMKDEIYDFQYDETHKMHKEWRALSEQPKRADKWYDLSDEELARWGFEFVGAAPTKEGTVTMYRANICHNPYISDNVSFRWSHAFAYSHTLPPMYMRDIFK
jgi:hypothetical protein